MITILNCGSNKTPMIGMCIPKGVEHQILDFLDFKSNSNQNIKGIIISGAPILITEQDIHPYLSQFNYLLTLNVPVLGICFGHQLMGLYFGSEGKKMAEDRVMNEITIELNNPLFKNLSKIILGQEDHCEWISLPQNFQRIGTSKTCENEAMMNEKKRLFGIQFHAEVSGRTGEIIFENFVNYCFSIDLK